MGVLGRGVVLGVLGLGLGLGGDQVNGFASNCPCLGYVNLTLFGNYSETGDCVFTAETNVNRCLPLDYGQGSCETFDENQPECVAPNPPTYCAGRWCYVDPNNCLRPNDPSQYFPGLTYSYETCGNVNAFSVERAFRGRKPSHIRVTYPSQASNGYAVLRDGNNNPIGAFPSFVEQTLNAAGVPHSTVPISNESLAIYSSEYSACVHDIALNNTDLCGGDFWRTLERELIATFGPDMTEDVFYIASYRVESKSWYDVISWPFLPFRVEVWGFIIGTAMVLSTIVGILEGEGTISKLKHWNYRGLLSFVSAAPLFESMYSVRDPGASQPSRLKYNSNRAINVIYGFFITVIVATYTATLTSQLVVDASKITVSTVTDILRTNSRVCITASALGAIKAREPRLSSLLIPGPTSALLDNMDAGICDVAILYEDAFNNNARYSSGGTHCNKVLSEAPVFSIGISLPVNPEHQHYLSYLFLKGVESGTFEREIELAKASYLPASVCEAVSPTRADLAVRLEDLAGIFIVVYLIVGTSLILWLIRKLCRTEEEATPKPASDTVIEPYQ